MADDSKSPCSNSPERLMEANTNNNEDGVSSNINEVTRTAVSNPDASSIDGEAYKDEEKEQEDPVSPQKRSHSNKKAGQYTSKLGELLEPDPLGEYVRKANGNEVTYKPIQRAKIVEANLQRKEITSTVEVLPELFPHASRRNLLRLLAEYDALLRPTPSTESGNKSVCADTPMQGARAAIIDNIQLPPIWDPSSARAIQEMLVDNQIDTSEGLSEELNKIRGELKGRKPAKYRAHGPQMLEGEKWQEYQQELFKRFPGGRERWLRRITKTQYKALAIAKGATNRERAGNRQENVLQWMASKRAKGGQTHATSNKRSTPDEGNNAPLAKPIAKQPRSNGRNRSPSLDRKGRFEDQFDYTQNGTAAPVPTGPTTGATVVLGTTLDQNLSAQSRAPDASTTKTYQRNTPRQSKVDADRISTTASTAATSLKKPPLQVAEKLAASKQNEHQSPSFESPGSHHAAFPGSPPSPKRSAIPEHAITATTTATTETVLAGRESIEQEIRDEYDLTVAEFDAVTNNDWSPHEYSELLKSKNKMPPNLTNKEEVAAILQHRPPIEQEIYRTYGLTIIQYNTAINKGWNPHDYRESLDRQSNTKPAAKRAPSSENGPRLGFSENGEGSKGDAMDETFQKSALVDKK